MRWSIYDVRCQFPRCDRLAVFSVEMRWGRQEFACPAHVGTLVDDHVRQNWRHWEYRRCDERVVVKHAEPQRLGTSRVVAVVGARRSR